MMFRSKKQKLKELEQAKLELKAIAEELERHSQLTVRRHLHFRAARLLAKIQSEAS
jgi:U3 small nucleolar RNA-associated protein 14